MGKNILSLASNQATNLASEINSEHRAVVAAANTGLEHARRAGELLLEARQRCERGEWQAWLADNLEFSAQSARAYMRIAERWGEIEAARQNESALSFSACLKLLAPPKDEGQQEPVSPSISEADLLDNMPELSDDHVLIGLPCDLEDSNRADYMLLVVPNDRSPGYWHVALHRGLSVPADATKVIYDRRGCKYDRALLARVLYRTHRVAPEYWYAMPVDMIDLASWVKQIVHGEEIGAGA